MNTDISAFKGMKLLIVSMTTWGEMGNWLSGKSLETTLTACLPDTSVRIEAAENLIPRFQAVGAAIKQATLDSQTPQERFDRYAAVLRGLEPLFPVGFEDDPRRFPELADELQTLVNYLRAEQPDLVIGTKGVICRALLGALRLAGLNRPVINYVTNHGHFQFAVHRCPAATLHVVRFPEGQDYLQAATGWPAESIRVVGYLIAAQQLLRQAAIPARLAPQPPTEVASNPGFKRSVIIVSNRGGREYIDLLERLKPYGDSIEVTFIAIRDEMLCELAEGVVREVGAATWRVVSELSQPELFKLMLRAQREGVCILVCKASPNSIFEAAYFGLPMFLLRTGLPMEEWGADMVVREGIGWVEETMAALAPQLTACLDDPTGLARTRERLQTFVATYLDQEKTVRKLLGAIAHATSTESREA